MSWLHEDSEVYKMLQGNQENKTSPRQSNSFRILQEALENNPDGGVAIGLANRLSPSVQKASAPPSSLSPNTQSPASSSAPAQLRVCEKCHMNISEVAVKISEGRYRHSACYVCADCGMNLRMRGHFWAGDELVCEKHARARYQTPTGSARR
ncbi:PDZ and LIM domain protein 2 [Rhinophrynus dorsalis]